ncbi:MAG: PadR family transcriptional regulator [Solirubrobacteraceae bacterium]|nr:PadR family transcriptional regulator [Solirubrobacteraceae bacterium]
MTPIKLTTPGYLVLGLVEQFEPATPYDLKNLAEISVAKFWALPHTQIYAQCDRLVEAGLLSEEREATGRRRRLLSITPEGKAALSEWRAAPAPDPVEIRSLATLKLFFGGDPAALAAEQVAQHEAQLAQYLELEQLDALQPGQRLALELGIGQEREFLRFWKQLAARE